MPFTLSHTNKEGFTAVTSYWQIDQVSIDLKNGTIHAFICGYKDAGAVKKIPMDVRVYDLMQAGLPASVAAIETLILAVKDSKPDKDGNPTENFFANAVQS